MSKKAKKSEVALYVVKCGCNTADGTRYEVGSLYDPNDHSEEDTSALMEMDCLEAMEAIDGNR